MEDTATSGPLSSGSRRSGRKAPPPPALRGGEGIAPDDQLVTRCISHRSEPEAFLVYPSAVKVVRPSYGKFDGQQPPERTEIEGFSDHSRRRLRSRAGNTSVPLISQYCLTYHIAYPDGRTVKAQLDTWLKCLRRRFPDVAYLWVLEFQTRGVPHFHVWLSLPHDLPGLRNILAKSWNRIAAPGDPEHLSFHNHKNNFTPWDMYAPGYLVKYLDKAHQKCVPEGFTGVGRFWGNSRNLPAIPETVTPADIDHLDCETMSETGNASPMAYMLRTLGKLHERKLRRSPWRSRARTAMTSYTLQTAAPAFRALRDYLQRCYEKNNDTPF